MRAVDIGDIQSVLRLSSGPLREVLIRRIESSPVGGRSTAAFGGAHVLVDRDLATVLFAREGSPMIAVLLRQLDADREPWTLVELGARETGVDSGISLRRVGGPFTEIDRSIFDEDVSELIERIARSDPNWDKYERIDWDDPDYVLSTNGRVNYTVGNVKEEFSKLTESEVENVARTDETWLRVYLRHLRPTLWLRE